MIMKNFYLIHKKLDLLITSAQIDSKLEVIFEMKKDLEKKINDAKK